MKIKIALFLTLLISTSAFANAPYPNNDTIIRNMVKPCFIQVSESSYANANLITVIEAYGNDKVAVYYGKASSHIRTDEGKQQAYIQRLLQTIRTTCQ